MRSDHPTLFGRPIDRRTLLAMTGKVLAGGTVAGAWLGTDMAGFVEAAARGRKTGGSVTVTSQFTPPGPAKWQSYFDAFTKETGISVILDDQNANNQYQKIATEGQSGGHSYDVVSIDTIWSGSFGRAGFTLDLTDFLPASVKGKIAPPALASVAYQGKLYGVPAFNSSKHFYYNKQMLDSVGLHHPPATLDDLLSYCATLKSNQAKLGIIAPMSAPWMQAENLTCDYVDYVDAHGGRFFAADNATPLFNHGAGVQALQFMVTLLKKGYMAPGSLTHGGGDTEKDLLSGKTAMCTRWEGVMTDSLNPAQATPAVRGHIRLALIPGSPARKSGSCLGPQGWAIMKGSRHQAEAKAFLNWWISTAAQKQGMLQFDQYPIYTSLYTDPSLRKLVAQSDGVDDFPIYGQQFAFAQPRPNFPGYLDASKRLQIHLQKALLGQETPQQALNAAAVEMKAASTGGNNP